MERSWNFNLGTKGRFISNMGLPRVDPCRRIFRIKNTVSDFTVLEAFFLNGKCTHLGNLGLSPGSECIRIIIKSSSQVSSQSLSPTESSNPSPYPLRVLESILLPDAAPQNLTVDSDTTEQEGNYL